MSDLNTFVKTDGVDDIMAALYNNLLAGNLRGELTNTQTLSADLTLGDISMPIQNLNPSGSDRIVLLPAAASGNHVFVFKNSGATYNLVIKDSTGVTIFATIKAGQIAMIVPIAGTTWGAVSEDASAPGCINLLLNGGFDLAQRQDPTTLTTIATDKYGGDRWRISSQAASLQYLRESGNGVAGLTSRFYGSFKQITNSGKFMAYQILEGIDTMPLRGKSVTFQCQMKASSAKTIRMAVIELQAAGVLDVIPATFIASYGANGTDPTLGANLAIIIAAQSKSVTTSMATFSITITVPSTSNNLICAIWTDSQFAANDTLSIAEAGLYAGASLQTWAPIPFADTLAKCQRYFYSVYNTDVAPGTNAAEGLIAFMSTLNNSLRGACLFPTPMRKSPKTVMYSYLGTTGKVSNVFGADVGITVYLTAYQKSCAVANESGGGIPFTVGTIYIFNFTADAEL